jgi:putative inorganic carbon (HCO3(-)) transporter
MGGPGIGKGLASVVLTVALASAATGLLLYLLQGSKKPVAAILGIALLGLILYFSGNPRLAALWGLGVTIPFDLSKRFGQYIEKMGGETAFRAELSDVFLVILIFYLVRDLWTQRRPGVLVPKITLVWIVIFGLGILSLVAGPFRLTVAHELVRMFKVLILFLVLNNELTSPARMLHCAGGMILGVVVQSSVGVLQFIRKKHLGLDLLGETGAGTLKQLADESIRTERVFRVGAFMNHPNIFGCFLAITIPLAIAIFLGRTNLKYKIFGLVGAGLGTVALIMTMSRSGWLSCAASVTFLVLTLLLHEKSRRRTLVAIVPAALILIVVCASFSDRIVTRLLESKEGAMLSRYEYIDTATRMIERKPIMGWGLNTYVWNAYSFTTAGARAARDTYKQWLPPVHNIYYLWTAELGFVGLAAHLLLFGGIIGVSIANFKVRDELLFDLNAACLAGLVAIMIDGWFSFTWRINSIMRVFWVIAAMIMAIQHWRKKGNRQRAWEKLASERPIPSVEIPLVMQ